MGLFRFVIAFVSLAIISPMSEASFSLNIKIGQFVGNKIVEVTETIQADYNKEIIIIPKDLKNQKSKNKIVINFKKIATILIEGSKISPVQVDIKLVNEMQKIIGYPQTVTSFYNRSAQFAVRSSGVASDTADINVSLNFEETN